MSGFQSTVNRQPAPAVEGDFASANPRASALAGDSQYVAGTGGALVGRFAGLDANGAITNVNYTGAPLGFIHRENQASITQWLGQASMQVQPGMPITVMVAGDFWARAAGSAAAVGQKVFAATADGSIQCAAAGTNIAGYVETAFVVRSACAQGELFKMSTHGK